MAPRRGRRRALTLVKTPPAPRYFTKDSERVFDRCGLELARALGRQAAREYHELERKAAESWHAEIAKDRDS